MEYLSDKLLIDSYKKALDLDLNQDFIRVLERELVRRKLHFSFKNIENLD
ncbi:developmental checkpoint coupling sporulation initiation to replication initiation [Virgibacillus natechei]|uniref:Developmental checkpoint coupling sporulation initiation to replication initiation n=1 Tax=Virgibacillus natechei TaxID=1216297 RepID=A0ABS4IES5_9BACI|nr:sporulation histidine kinase inhibitor Sda [Virgibacillus natechei]MBP1969457.1 developmental checkpoint coupling sporulation initiation to replication initiation [Virgibacillus natechei]UZD11835.1 sporulation histidine kinase inhibitor Sda [Virgibacillus natechei]